MRWVRQALTKESLEYAQCEAFRLMSCIFTHLNNFVGQSI